tara:strand:- start:367 stop:1062 length:696 start_codon:yes stop_codon:yes gene_type:complete
VLANKRILIIGNSHNVALFKNLEVFNNAGMEVDFLHSKGESLLDLVDFSSITLKLKDNSNPNLNKRMQRIKSLIEYDHVVVYGLRLRAWGDGNGNWNDLITLDNRYSTQVILTCINQFIEDSAHYQILSQLKKITEGIDVISLPGPLPITPEEFDRSINFNFVEKFSCILKEKIQSLGARYSATPRELEDSTGCFTAEEFKSEKGNDYIHLNSIGGKLMVEHIMKCLGESL